MDNETQTATVGNRLEEALVPPRGTPVSISGPITTATYYLQWLYQARKRYGLTVLEFWEGDARYQALFEAENEDIGPENTYLWDIKGE